MEYNLEKTKLFIKKANKIWENNFNKFIKAIKKIQIIWKNKKK
jgi:hypothetical protein